MEHSVRGSSLCLILAIVLGVGFGLSAPFPATAQESAGQAGQAGQIAQGTPATRANQAPPSPADVYQLLQNELEALESRQPREQAACFRIRQLADQLYRTATPNPTDPQGFAGIRVPDLDAGRDLYAGCQGLSDDALRRELLRIMSASHAPIGYQTAQDVIFSKLDNVDGQVECVYTGKTLATLGEPSAEIMNVEHTWPQSQGATGIAKADLHHLFPTDSRANNIRGNLPFALVSNPEWEEGGSKCDGDQFEVRPPHRGNVARAKFYFATRYSKQIPPQEEQILRAWHKEDPVDANERSRNDRIENIQHDRNPFVDHPEFVDQIKDF